MSPALRSLAALSVCVAGLSACGRTADVTISSPTLTVTATDYAYTPSIFSEQPGSTVTVVLINRGGVEHSILFELPGGALEMTPYIAPGKGGQADLKIPIAHGRYQFYCPVAGHKALGEVGTMVVGPRTDGGAGSD